MVEDARERRMERTDGAETIGFDLLVNSFLIHDPIDVNEFVFSELRNKVVFDGTTDSVGHRSTL